MEEKGQGAAPEQILNHNENLSLTGYFNDGRKRIDIVLVFKDEGSDLIKGMRFNFLMNVIQFGLEAEVEPGKMAEHRDLIFVKLHAPDAIIEEFGLYFNEKSFFKHSHTEFMNPIVNIFGVSNERELIKIVRAQYPGPDNYSTLERSNIVYKILLKIPFGQYKNYFGIHELIHNYIIQDAFALHDGPYFIVPKQNSTNMNARQVLFYEWMGIINVWKMQPIHMIHEYFGKRISYYFAFHEYFNFMLIIPSIVGAFIIYYLYQNINDVEEYQRYTIACDPNKDDHSFMCPECRNYTLCPIIRKFAYCNELKFLAMIDKDSTYVFGSFITIWGIFFLIPWRYRERYLTWIWEETKRYTNKLVRPEYVEPDMYEEDKRERNKTKLNYFVIINILTAIFLGFWGFLMFRFSIIIWHYPRWKRLQEDPKLYVFKEGEHVNIAAGAGMYTITVYILKMVFMILAQKLTGYENNKTFLIYERSMALKMYAFSFLSSFTILITYTYIGGLFPDFSSSHMYHHMGGYGMMNSAAGSSFDDICIILGIMTMLEHVIFKMPRFFMANSPTDYSIQFDLKAPCWEREYKLKPINEFFFHKRYNDLAMQFALLTCYSMVFPVASLLLFIINIWDIRQTARQLLLEYRRPLLINTSGPRFWKYLMWITALYAPMSNAAIIIFQSLKFFRKNLFLDIHNIFEDLLVVGFIDKVSSAKADHKRMVQRIKKNYKIPPFCTSRRRGPMRHNAMIIEKEVRYILFVTLIGAVLGLFLTYVIPGTSNSLNDTIKKEQRIKNKYYIHKGLSKLSD